MTLRIVVADDQALVRVGFCGIISATAGLEVVGEAANGSEAVTAAREAKPDVVLMDVRMPVMDGIEATRQITASTDVRVLILTTFDLDEYVYAALRAGASGFLLKDTLPADLLNAIRVVAGGDALLAPSVTRRLIGEFARSASFANAAAAGLGQSNTVRPEVKAAATAGATACAANAQRALEVLTDREREVLELVARGMSNAEIAGHLTISPATAKTHVAHLLTKLDARDRIQLVILAFQCGLVVLSTLISHFHGGQRAHHCRYDK
jgi:DNA-binding NarL/FixJ family response regulator